MKQIKFKWIVGIQRATIKLFEAQDEDFPDGRCVAAQERTIGYYLDKITDDREERLKILEIIENENWNMQDITYKPICDRLRALGYEIVMR